MKRFYEIEEFINKFSERDYREFKFILQQEISIRTKLIKKITNWILVITLLNLLLNLVDMILMLL